MIIGLAIYRFYSFLISQISVFSSILPRGSRPEALPCEFDFPGYLETRAGSPLVSSSLCFLLAAQ